MLSSRPLQRFRFFRSASSPYFRSSSSRAQVALQRDQRYCGLFCLRQTCTVSNMEERRQCSGACWTFVTTETWTESSAQPI